MRKDYFYICSQQKEHPKSKPEIVAIKVSGYSDGDIGLHETIPKHKSGKEWVATYIPTGEKITPVTSSHQSARMALSEAKRLLAKNPDLDKLIQSKMEREPYLSFSKSRYNQSITKNYVGMSDAG